MTAIPSAFDMAVEWIWTGFPSTRIVPLSREWSPDRILIRVDAHESAVRQFRDAVIDEHCTALSVRKFVAVRTVGDVPNEYTVPDIACVGLEPNSTTIAGEIAARAITGTCRIVDKCAVLNNGDLV